MSVFEQVVALSDRASGLDGFVVIHDTTRGPATGGIRVLEYASAEDALTDGIRLARAMTFKAAAADLPVGGGKIVLTRPPDDRREDALRAVGRAIEAMEGTFLAGRDVGVPVEDGAVVRAETSYMVDESEEGVGDLNRATAAGVLAGARAALQFQLGCTDFAGVRVALQGAGGVGTWLARKLAAEGAELYVADPSRGALERLARSVRFEDVGVENIYSMPCELFAPCAIGSVLDDETGAVLRAKIVVGSANNVLARAAVGDALAARGVLYVPDYLVNAGALIQGVRFLLHGERRSPEAIAAIGTRTASLLARAHSNEVPPFRLLALELQAEFDLDTEEHL